MENNTNTQATEGQVTETQVEATETTKIYTEEEVQKLLQAEGDRRVTQALQKQEKKMTEKIAEAQKLAQMNEQEKYEYQLKQREEAIAARERDLALSENKNEASKILAEKGISLALVDFVVAEDAETMKHNIDTLDRAFKASVKSEVEKRLASSTPKTNLPLDKAMTKEDFMKLSYSEMLALKQQDPALYQQLAH